MVEPAETAEAEVIRAREWREQQGFYKPIFTKRKGQLVEYWQCDSVMAAFAAFEVSRVRRETREQDCKAVCRYCAAGNVPEMHKSTDVQATYNELSHETGGKTCRGHARWVTCQSAGIRKLMDEAG